MALQEEKKSLYHWSCQTVTSKELIRKEKKRKKKEEKAKERMPERIHGTICCTFWATQTTISFTNCGLLVCPC